MMKRKIFFLLPALLCAALLAGCSGSALDIFFPTPSPTATAEPTPSPAPETPDASDAEIENLRWTVTVLAVAAAVLFIGAAVLGTLLIRSITRPVRKVKR